jgi:hypothetical protein
MKWLKSRKTKIDHRSQTEQVTDNDGLGVAISCLTCRILGTEIIIDIIHPVRQGNEPHNANLHLKPLMP